MSATRKAGGRRSVVLLSGGVGGAKMAWGLAQLLEPGEYRVVANTADDFEHLGLYISPDVDTVIYTLAGLVNEQSGWGRKGESWRVLETLKELGGVDWFRLGDLDLATHLYRTGRLKQGATLSEICAELCAALGVHHEVLPMSDQSVRTVLQVRTEDGTQREMDFQEYFVRHRCAPEFVSAQFRKSAGAQPSPRLIELLSDEHLSAIIIAPSNPILSIDPILSFEEIPRLLSAATAPIVAVSPIVAGQAIKGPLSKIMRELGMEPSPSAVARHYRDFLNGFVLDSQDAECADAISVPVCAVPTIMDSAERKLHLAESVLNFCQRLADDS